MADILSRVKIFLCPKMKNKLKSSGPLHKLMMENEIRAQNQIARIANHNLIEKQPKIVPENIEVYQNDFTSLKPSMCNQTLQEIIWKSIIFETHWIE